MIFFVTYTDTKVPPLAKSMPYLTASAACDAFERLRRRIVERGGVATVTITDEYKRTIYTELIEA